MIFSIFVKHSRPHHCHRLTSQLSSQTNTSLCQRSSSRRRGPTSSQEMFVLLSQRPALGRGRPHRRHSMFHRSRQVLAPFASSACAHLLLPNCAVWPSWSDCPSSAVVSVVRAPLGSSRQTLWWISCASFGSLSCTSSKADSLWFPPQHLELDHHTKSRHGEALCPSQRSGPSRHVIMFLSKKNWFASLWWTQHLRSWANMSGETVSKNECESECDK